MLKAIKQMKVVNQRLNFSIGIDGTKVTQSLNINNAQKCIMGGTYQNHMINSINLGKEYVNKIIENKEKPIVFSGSKGSNYMRAELENRCKSDSSDST